ncbi:centromere protein T-like [Ptychodera flava]|uniref:centromere protein T-like n=1 Tax=Ptychodera flava TaxID=63121 RepID=UPI00396A066D
MYGMSHEPEETPRTLIKQFLKNAKTAKLSNKKASRIERPKAPSVSKRSVQKQVAATVLTRSARKKFPQTLLPEEVTSATPRTLIKGFLQHAPIRTPAIHIPKQKKAAPALPALQVPSTQVTRKRTRSSSKGIVEDEVSDSFETRKTPSFKRRRAQRMSVGTFGRGVQEKMREDETTDDSQEDPSSQEEMRETVEEQETQKNQSARAIVGEADMSGDYKKVPNFKRRAQHRMSLGTFSRGVRERMAEDYGDGNVDSQTESSAVSSGEIGQPEMESTLTEVFPSSQSDDNEKSDTVQQPLEQRESIEMSEREDQEMILLEDGPDVDKTESNVTVTDTGDVIESEEMREPIEGDVQTDAVDEEVARDSAELEEERVVAERLEGSEKLSPIAQDDNQDDDLVNNGDDNDDDEVQERDEQVYEKGDDIDEEVAPDEEEDVAVAGSSGDELDDINDNVVQDDIRDGQASGKSATSKDTAQAGPSGRQTVKRVRKPPGMKTVFPRSLTKNIFTFYSKLKVRPQAMESVYAGSEKFLQKSFKFLHLYAKHANRKTITKEDVELLMRRQRFVTDKQSLNNLIEKMLPLEYRQELIPIARSGNKLEPKPK